MMFSIKKTLPYVVIGFLALAVAGPANADVIDDILGVVDNLLKSLGA
ncbi:hypothetical protein [Pseudomonas sp. S2_H01]